MGYRDLGDFQRKSGDLQGAVRSYTQSRDYCTTSQHVLDMCLSIIDVSGAGTTGIYCCMADLWLTSTPVLDTLQPHAIPSPRTHCV